MLLGARFGPQALSLKPGSFLVAKFNTDKNLKFKNNKQLTKWETSFCVSPADLIENYTLY